MSQDIYIILIRSEPRELCKILKDRTESSLYDDFAVIYVSDDLENTSKYYATINKKEKKYWRNIAKYLIKAKKDTYLNNGLMHENILYQEFWE
jgi:hypothetical protein